MLKLIVAAILLAQSVPLAAQTVSLEFSGGTFSVRGWSAPPIAPLTGWPSLFAVYAGPADTPPLLGSYAVETGTLVFHPAFPIAPGVRYRAVFHPTGASPVERIFAGPPRATTPIAVVEHIYPSTSILPSNQLRLYLYFSQPMSRGEAERRIHLLDANGKALPDVFLPGQELWDPSYKRLTMTFDPGRIKRGLTSNSKLGPPIAVGKRYTLVVDQGWLDARGVPLLRGLRKTFRGGPAERTAPDTNQWHVVAPKHGSSDALLVEFPTPMNYPLLLRMLQVTGNHGIITGSVTSGRDETEWRFKPERPWTEGDYQLIVDTAIEDLAGNHIGQPFDLDVFDRVFDHMASKTISLRFRVP